MSNQSAVVNVHPFVRTSSAPDPDASDPTPIMRREINLLRIEMEHLRGKEDEARKIKEFLLAYVERVEYLRANRDEWQREAERLSALIGQMPRWLIFWARCCFNASKTWRKLTSLWAARGVRIPTDSGQTPTGEVLAEVLDQLIDRCRKLLAELGRITSIAARD